MIIITVVSSTCKLVLGLVVNIAPETLSEQLLTVYLFLLLQCLRRVAELMQPNSSLCMLCNAVKILIF